MTELGCRVLVCGGRDFANRDLLFAALDAIHAKRNFVLEMDGDYRGADRLAKDWAEWRGIRRLPFPADWTRYGGQAGPIRNQQMLDEGRPDLVVAFEGDNGTADMSRRALRAGVELIEIRTLRDAGVDVEAETTPDAHRGRHYGDNAPRAQTHTAEAVVDWLPDAHSVTRNGIRKGAQTGSR